MARQRSPNFPPSMTIASSPAERRFTTAASMAPEPEQESVSAGSAVPRCSCINRVVSRKYCRYSSVRWWMRGFPIAWRTSEGTSVGPGVKSTRFMILPGPGPRRRSVRVRLRRRRLLFLSAAEIGRGFARLQGDFQDLVHRLDQLELHRVPDVIGQFLKVLLVQLGDDHRLHAGALGRDHLLVQAADGQDVPEQGDLAR